jgi:hypothetical protein
MPSGHAHGLLRSGELHEMSGGMPARWKPAGEINVGDDLNNVATEEETR